MHESTWKKENIKMNALDTIPASARVYIYGTGSAGRSLWMWLRKCRVDVRVLGFIDSFKDGKLEGKNSVYLTVHPFQSFVKRIPKDSYDLILVASGANREIAALLKQNDLPFKVMAVPSYLMENLLPISSGEKIIAAGIKLISPLFKRRLHLFFGEHGGKFIGNNKYFYLYLKKHSQWPVYWVVEDDDLYRELRAANISVLDFRNKSFIFTLLRASFFYFDNMTWQRKYPWLRYFKARIIHMSHGVGLKMTEKMLIPGDFMERLTDAEEKRLNERIFKNDLLVSTSQFYAENVSAPAYNTPPDKITLDGYPKNDLFYRQIDGAEVFAHTQTLEHVRSFKQRGYKILVYAPTFRDMDNRFKYAGVVDFNRFNHHLNKNRLVLVIKGHTSTAAKDDQHPRTGTFSNILFYPSHRDGYPLLKESDLLITDYSSIYMDYLHHRKPVLFFVYDYEEYITGHREIQFDYEKMTPGPKARNYEELIHWIAQFLVKENDGFRKFREKVFELAFLYPDGNASDRLFRAIYDIV